MNNLSATSEQPSSLTARMELAVNGAALLYARGAGRVWLFGSLERGYAQDEHSDIDLAVEGLSRNIVRLMASELPRLLGCSVDLIEMETVLPYLRSYIVRKRTLMPK